MALKEEIASRIEEFFNKKGGLKKDFAKELGVVPQRITMIFKAKLDPLDYIDKLESLGADKIYLLTGVRMVNSQVIKEPAIEYNVGKELRDLQEENKKLNQKIAIIKKALDD